MDVKIKYKGNSLIVYGNYQKGIRGDGTAPPDQPEFNILSIEFEGVNVIDFFYSEELTEIERLCLIELLY